MNDIVNDVIQPNFNKLKISSPQLNKQNSNLKSQVTKDDFSLGKKLGKGQFGEVFIAKHKKTGFICALKIIKKSTIKE